MNNEARPATARRSPPTPSQVIAEQKRVAEKDTAARKASSVPAKVGANSTALATPDNRTDVQRYLDDIAPANVVGRIIKFSKDGKFITADDGEPINEAVEFIALCDETLTGWIKFNGDDAPPDRIQGLLYDNWVMPARASLGDMDETQWPDGLSGQAEDPWHHQICLVLQHVETRELFTFVTTSQTGRRAVGNLLRHFDRMQRTNTDELPVVRLRPGGFNHRKVGWVPVPVFAVVGRTPRDSAAKPDTSVAADLNDEVPFLS
jgi:hypothetical protein